MPPTLNLDAPDPAAEDLDLVAGESHTAYVKHILSNGFGFGGVNASVLFGRGGERAAGEGCALEGSGSIASTHDSTVAMIDGQEGQYLQPAYRHQQQSVSGCTPGGGHIQFSGISIAVALGLSIDPMKPFAGR